MNQHRYYLFINNGYDGQIRGPMTIPEYDQALQELGGPDGSYDAATDTIVGIRITLDANDVFQSITAWTDAPNEGEEEEEEK